MPPPRPLPPCAGSDKPFEKMRKEMQKKQAELQRRERDVCKSVWLPYGPGEGPGAKTDGGPAGKKARSE